jgi:hypothetical protein
MKKKWMVEHLYCSGWADAEWLVDGQPIRFNTKKEAIAEIDDLIKSARHLGYRKNEYRAVRATS